MTMSIARLFFNLYQVEPERVEPLTQAGSSRRYYRLAAPTVGTIIGVEGVDHKENEAFIYLSHQLADAGCNVPAVLAVSEDRMSYLISDLGDVALASCLDNKDLLKKAMTQLAIAHTFATHGMNWDICFPVEAMDTQAALWDLNYFKYSFLNTEGITYSEPLLEIDFSRLAERCDQLSNEQGVLMLRDFQSRNVMVHEDNTYLIDYQGARKGPAAYDVASFLWQAKARFPQSLRDELTDFYLDEVSRLGGGTSEREVFHRYVQEMALLRTLQVLGAYGLRGRFERKPHFEQSIPAAIENLSHLITDKIKQEYPYLSEILSKVIDKEREKQNDKPQDNVLTVRVTSFSFKKGYPADPSGNGGGFVFDCRAMDNPGRYEPYKKLTGLDSPVRNFLEEKGEIQLLLTDAEHIVDRAVDNYRDRGFSSLCVSFGCTGGQHRSVYGADAMARHLNIKYPDIRVILTHREQGITEIFNPS